MARDFFDHTPRLLPERRFTKSSETIDDSHCSQCGNTDPSDVNTGFDPEYQGYSRCCNEPVVHRCIEDYCSHGGQGNQLDWNDPFTTSRTRTAAVASSFEREIEAAMDLSAFDL